VVKVEVCDECDVNCFQVLTAEVGKAVLALKGGVNAAVKHDLLVPEAYGRKGKKKMGGA
jgi:hypothetical protein